MQTITVNDDTAPVAPSAPADVVLQCAADVPAPLDLTAVDNCDGDITVSPMEEMTAQPGACPSDFVLVRTWTFTDVCGNESSVMQTITVNDDISPMAICQNVEIIIDPSGKYDDYNRYDRQWEYG